MHVKLTGSQGSRILDSDCLDTVIGRPVEHGLSCCLPVFRTKVHVKMTGSQGSRILDRDWLDTVIVRPVEHG